MGMIAGFANTGGGAGARAGARTVAGASGEAAGAATGMGAEAEAPGVEDAVAGGVAAVPIAPGVGSATTGAGAPGGGALGPGSVGTAAGRGAGVPGVGEVGARDGAGDVEGTGVRAGAAEDPDGPGWADGRPVWFVNIRTGRAARETREDSRGGLEGAGEATVTSLSFCFLFVGFAVVTVMSDDGEHQSFIVQFI